MKWMWDGGGNECTMQCVVISKGLTLFSAKCEFGQTFITQRNHAVKKRKYNEQHDIQKGQQLTCGADCWGNDSKVCGILVFGVVKCVMSCVWGYAVNVFLPSFLPSSGTWYKAPGGKSRLCMAFLFTDPVVSRCLPAHPSIRQNLGRNPFSFSQLIMW